MILDIPLNKKIHTIHPEAWKTKVNLDKLDYAAFRNLEHFKHYVSKLTQREDMKCDVSYAEALADLKAEKSQFNDDEYEQIRNLVRTNLLKRGLITEEIYESYKYDVEGVAVDVAKVIEGNPECFLAPSVSYTNYFYELYINVSYPGGVTDATIRENMGKILATVEELERQHIYIKITVVDCSGRVSNDGRDLITVLPLFNHRDIKSLQTMSAVVNERLLRKFMFAMSEDIYGSNLSEGYGRAMELPDSIRPVNLNEVELFESIYDKVINPGVR